MKRWIALAGVLVLVGSGVGLAAWMHREARVLPSSQATGPEAAVAEAFVGVEELMRNADRYRSGPLELVGVVSAISESEGLLGLIDCREFEECGITTCAELTLPVRWSGKMPREKETIRLRGEIREAGEKLVFVAATLVSIRSKESTVP